MSIDPYRYRLERERDHYRAALEEIADEGEHADGPDGPCSCQSCIARTALGVQRGRDVAEIERQIAEMDSQRINAPQRMPELLGDPEYARAKIREALEAREPVGPAASAGSPEPRLEDVLEELRGKNAGLYPFGSNGLWECRVEGPFAMHFIAITPLAAALAARDALREVKP